MTVTATEMRQGVAELSTDLEDCGRRLNRMSSALRRAGREVGDGLTKAAIKAEVDGLSDLARSLERAWDLLDSIDTDLSKLEREASKGRGYQMPASSHPIEQLPFMAKREVRRPGGVPFLRRAASEGVPPIPTKKGLH